MILSVFVSLKIAPFSQIKLCPEKTKSLELSVGPALA